MRIDSNTIELPFDAIRHIDRTYLTHDQQIKSGNIIKDVHFIQSKELPFGISDIFVNNRSESVRVGTSAKVLGNKYLEGINLNTFSEWIDNVNSLGIIDIDRSKAFDLGKFHKIDTTNNVDFTQIYDLDKSWSEVLAQLQISKLNDRFNAVSYNRKDNQGITFIGEQKVEKNRLIMYRKYLDLQKASNREFLNSMSKPFEFLKSTKNILRVEQNHTSARSIRTRLKIDSTNINKVLTNGINPNPEFLDKITQPHRENQLLMVFNEYSPEHYDINEIVKLEGIKNIIRSANYCEKTLYQFVKRYTSGPMLRWWWYGGKPSVPAFRPLIHELRFKDQNQNPQTSKVITFLRNQLAMDKVA